MDLETLSKRIIDSQYGLEIEHSDDNFEIDSPSENGNELTHYGIPGMKWGVRKDRKSTSSNKTRKVKFRDRRYEGESAADYKARLAREHQERMAKIESKERLKNQKMVLKSQEKQRKAEEKERKRKEQEAKTQQQNSTSDKKSRTDKSVKAMTDQELNDAINRLRRELEYKNLQKGPDSLMTKTLKQVSSFGGGILVKTGQNIIVKQLSDVGNQYADDFLKKKGIKKTKEEKKEAK